MRSTDVVIVGGGLAGSLAAAMLGRAGIPAVLVDPHVTYPPDFRCEKLDGSQVAILRRTGLADPILRACVHDRSVWIAKYGRLAEKRPSDQHGILYDRLVAATRAQIPQDVERIVGKATAIETSAERQSVVLSDGERISARLVIVANGLNVGLREALGMPRLELSPAHSVSLGFDMAPADRAAFPFRALTYYAERPSDRIAYLTLFPIEGALRANLMVYRSLDDPWLKGFRENPEAALKSVMPRLKTLIGGFRVEGPVKMRPADLYSTQNTERAGIVLVGDAFGTSCPAAGTGASKVFTDVERLCNHHIPGWLSTDGMGEEKIAQFYADPVKQACDEASLQKAYRLRELCTSEALNWRARRAARFLIHRGMNTLRQARATLGRKHEAVGTPEAGISA